MDDGQGLFRAPKSRPNSQPVRTALPNNDAFDDDGAQPLARSPPGGQGLIPRTGPMSQPMRRDVRDDAGTQPLPRSPPGGQGLVMRGDLRQALKAETPSPSGQGLLMRDDLRQALKADTLSEQGLVMRGDLRQALRAETPSHSGQGLVSRGNLRQALKADMPPRAPLTDREPASGPAGRQLMRRLSGNFPPPIDKQALTRSNIGGQAPPADTATPNRSGGASGQGAVVRQLLRHDSGSAAAPAGFGAGQTPARSNPGDGGGRASPGANTPPRGNPPSPPPERVGGSSGQGVGVRQLMRRLSGNVAPPGSGQAPAAAETPPGTPPPERDGGAGEPIARQLPPRRNSLNAASPAGEREMVITLSGLTSSVGPEMQATGSCLHGRLAVLLPGSEQAPVRAVGMMC